MAISRDEHRGRLSHRADVDGKRRAWPACQRLTVHHVHRAERVGRFVVECRWHKPRLQSQHARRQFHSAATGTQVSEETLGGRDWRVSDLGDDIRRLDAISIDGADAMGIHVAERYVKLVRSDSGLFERSPDGQSQRSARAGFLGAAWFAA